MTTGRIAINTVIGVFFLLVGISCASKGPSTFVEQSFKPVELSKMNYRVLKGGAVGEDTGFKLIWISFVSPVEGEAKRDMLARLKQEGIDTAGKNIGFANATYSRVGRGLFGLIGFPTIVPQADVIEVLGAEVPAQVSPPEN